MEKNNRLNLPAVILAAGQGKRLLPYTESLPKVLVEIEGRPLLDYVLMNLIQVDIRHFFIIVGYKAELVKSWVLTKFLPSIPVKYGQIAKNQLSSLKFEFILQDEINGTGSASLLAEPFLRNYEYSAFLLTYGDLLISTTVFKRLITTFRKEDQDIFLVGNPTDDPSAGAAIYYEGDKILNLIEKPNHDALKTDLNNSGLYIFKMFIFKELQNSQPSIRGEIELTDPIIRLIHEKNSNIRLIKVGKDEFWCDVGTVESFRKVRSDHSWFSQMQL